MIFSYHDALNLTSGSCFSIGAFWEEGVFHVVCCRVVGFQETSTPLKDFLLF